jgi:DNA-binding beta-propeller fold protein YncE
VKRTRVVFACIGLAVGVVDRAALGESPSRAYVLDSGTPALSVLDLEAGTRAASLALEGAPEGLKRSPDGTRLVVLDRGPGDDKGDRGYKAKGKSWATIVDAATLTLVARVELGWGIEPPGGFFSADARRLTVICPGYQAKNPAEALPRELVTVDLVTGKVTGRLALEHGAHVLRATRDGSTLVLLKPGAEDKGVFGRSTLTFVDLDGPSVAGTLEVAAFGCAHADDSYAYLLDPGKPDDDPRKDRNGSFEVVSIAARKREGTFDAGRSPACLVADEPGGQAYSLSDGPRAREGRPDGELRVFSRGELKPAVKVACHPRLVTRERDQLLVVGEQAVTLVDAIALQSVATIPLGGEGHWLVDDDAWPTEVRTSPDGKRAFVLYAANERLVVLDLEQRKAVGATAIGRGGKKFLRSLGKLNAMAMGMTYGGWAYSLSSPANAFLYGYNFYSPTSPDHPQLAVRPDGAFAYALDRQTKDVTVVDATTGQSGEKIATSGYELKLLTGGAGLAVVSGSSIRLVDTRSHKADPEVQLSGLRGVFSSPDGLYAVAAADKAVAVLDGSTGKVRARLTDFVKPDVVLFAEPAIAASPRP